MTHARKSAGFRVVLTLLALIPVLQTSSVGFLRFAHADPRPPYAPAGQSIPTGTQARTLFLTGFNYAHGNGVPKNYTKAVEAYTKAAEAGFAPAQYNLGRLYQNGHGCPKDPARAARYFRAAAEQDLILAQYALGTMYETGEGLSKDFKAALDWYSKAAAKGDAPAQFRVGLFYEEGLGTTKDLTQAAFWYTKAAEQGYAPAQNNLGTLYEVGQGGLPANPSLAVRLYHKAAMRGHRVAQANLAACYRHGRGVRQDERKAEAWERRATKRPSERLQYATPRPHEEYASLVRERPLPLTKNRGLDLASYGRIPSPVLEDTEQKPGFLTKLWQRARTRTEETASSNLARAKELYQTGLAYEKGTATAKRNISKALSFYRAAANMSYAPAAYRLGCMYEGDPSNEQEKEQAYAWFLTAADLGHTKAQYRLGRLFERGFGVAQDRTAARLWYDKAAKAGDTKAQEALARLQP